MLGLHQGPGWKLGRVRITPQKEEVNACLGGCLGRQDIELVNSFDLWLSKRFFWFNASFGGKLWSGLSDLPSRLLSFPDFSGSFLWQLLSLREFPEAAQLRVIPLSRISRTGSRLSSSPRHCFGRALWTYRIWASMPDWSHSSRLEVRSHTPRRLLSTRSWEIPFERGL